MSDAPTAADAKPGPMVAEAAPLCRHCGYTLRGLTELRCPECGHGFDPATASGTRLPWAHRRHLGVVAAYVQTVWLATFWPGRIAVEIEHRQDYGDSQRFRWITVMLAWPLLPVFFFIARATFLEQLVFGLPLLLVVAALTGVPSYLFHPRWLPIEMQNRAIALSYYMAGPLGFSPLVCIGGAIAAWSVRREAGVIAIAAGALAVFLLWWRGLFSLSRRMQSFAERRRGPWAVIFVPIAWLLCAVVVYLLLVGPAVLFLQMGRSLMTLVSPCPG